MVKSMFLELVENIHRKLVYGKRVKIIAENIVQHVHDKAEILDIGCGQGTVGKMLMELNPTLSVTGIEVKRRKEVQIPCLEFSGKKIPLEKNTFDVSLLVDVLHHTDDVKGLLEEATRVSKKYVIIKDHCCENEFQYFILKLMDWVGNRPHEVSITYKYLSKNEWFSCFKECNLEKVYWSQGLSLYSPPLNWFCRPKLHMIAVLEKRKG